MTNKSTNHPILTQHTTAAALAYDSVAAITLPQPHKREIHLPPKIHLKKKPRLGPQGTPQPIVEAGPPTRPRKSRQAGPSLEDQDFPTILSPSKARRPDCRSNFRRYSGILEGGSGRPYYEPPTLLGINDAGMNDNISTISGTWVRERAKNVFGGTKKVAERILGISPSSARYIHQQQRNGTPGLDGVGLVAQGYRVAQKRRITKYPVPSPVSTSEIESSDKDLRDCLEDPFSAPGDYELDQNVNAKVNKGGSNEPCYTKKPNQETRGGLRRLESTQNSLVLGSTKAKRRHAEEAVVTKWSDSGSCTEDRSPASSFLATTDPSLGATYESNHSESENEMPSSSPMAKSTPKKDWHRYKNRDTAGTPMWKTNRRTEGRKSNPVKPLIIALDSSDTDCIEGMSIGELTNDDIENKGGGGGWDESVQEEAKLFTGNGTGESPLEKKEMAIRFRRIKHPLLRDKVPEDKDYKYPYKIEISGSDTAGGERNYCPLKMGIGGSSGGESGRRAIANANIIYLKEDKENPRKRYKDIIRTDGSRVGKSLLRDKVSKLTGRVEGVTVGFGGSGGGGAVISRAPSKSVVGGGTGKKAIKRRKPSLAYDRNDVDELQMDLPGMRI